MLVIGLTSSQYTKTVDCLHALHSALPTTVGQAVAAAIKRDTSWTLVLGPSPLLSNTVGLAVAAAIKRESSSFGLGTRCHYI